jgi:hypothetical protein
MFTKWFFAIYLMKVWGKKPHFLMLRNLLKELHTLIEIITLVAE